MAEVYPLMVLAISTLRELYLMLSVVSIRFYMRIIYRFRRLIFSTYAARLGSFFIYARGLPSDSLLSTRDQRTTSQFLRDMTFITMTSLTAFRQMPRRRRRIRLTVC